MGCHKRKPAQSMVEFALVVPLFLLLLLGLIDFSRLLFTYVSMTNAARELARSITIGTNPMATVVPAFNNLLMVGGPLSGASSVTFAPPTGGGSGSITCSGTSDALCTLQMVTAPIGGPELSTSGCNTSVLNNVSVTLSKAPSVTTPLTSATYTSSNFNYAFNPTGNGDFVMMTWASTDQCGLQQGFIQVCRLPFTEACAFPTDLNRSANSNGMIQVDLRHTFQFNPLYQNRLSGVIDVSFMRPSTQVTTTVRTYAE